MSAIQKRVYVIFLRVKFCAFGLQCDARLEEKKMSPRAECDRCFMGARRPEKSCGPP